MVRWVLAACAFAVAIGGRADAQSGASADGPAAKATQPGIVVIAPDDITRPWVGLITQGFRDVVLAGEEQPAVHFESLDLVRFENASYSEGLRRWLGEKYRSTRVDVVVALGEPALTFLASRPGEPWPGASVIYIEAGGVGIDVPRVLPDSTGVILEDSFASALDVVRQILPETRRIALVAGTSKVEESRFGGFGDKVRQAGLQPLILSALGLDGVASAVASLHRDTVVYILAPVVDGTQRVLSPAQPCAVIATAASVPTFTLAHHDFGCGVVGGLMRDWHAVGRLVGKQTLARLRGPLPAVVDVPISAYTALEFDERQLKRWAIPEDRLPEGSRVRYRSTNLWRDYRGLSLAVLTVLAVQAGLILWLVVERLRRQRAEVDARRHLVTMAHLDRRAALGELTTALAHELHQPLTAILRNSEAASMQLTAGTATDEELLEIISDIHRDDKRAAAIIRRLRSLLEKHELEEAAVDLHDVVHETIAVAGPDASSRGVRLELALAARRQTVTGDRVHLQQVLLNLLMNGVDAVAGMQPERRRLTVQSVSDDTSVEICVVDTGPGLPADVAPQMFEPFFTTKSAAKGTGLGLGLSIVRSIVEAHGGQVHARNNDHDGATVGFRLPLRSSEGA